MELGHAVDGMVAGIAHEIRNPLGIIRSTAELLLKRSKDTDGVNAKLLSAIFDESKRLSKTVGDFLDYARPKAPKQEKVDLAVVLDQALMFLETKCEEQGVAIIRDYAPGLVVLGDKDLLYRAVYNILSNALESMYAGIIVVGVLGFALNAGFVTLRRRVLCWMPEGERR